MGLPVGKVGFRALCWLRRRTDLRMDADAGLAGGGGGGAQVNDDDDGGGGGA